MQIPESWTFKNKHIADNFDDHVAEQLPWYHLATDIVRHIATGYLSDSSVLVDLGCSTGNITNSLKSTIEARNISAFSYDNSDSMIAIFNGVGECRELDIADYDEPFDVAILFLSLMFLSDAKKEKLLASLIKNMNKGGAIIIMDKIEAGAGYLGTVISRISMLNKLNAGADPEAILRKELSLNGVQRPVRRKLLDELGFTQFFQIGEFVGMIYDDDSRMLNLLLR